MSDYAAYENHRIVSGSIVMPTYGLWTADLTFADETDLPSTGTVTIGDLTLAGYVHRTGGYAGKRSARLAAGAGGWRKRVPAQAYHLPLGVPLALVLGDVASLVGERVDLADVGLLGGYYFRDADVAQRVLRRLAGPIWYVDVDGTTRIRERPSDVIGSDFLVTSYEPASGRLVIATEHLSDWTPGRTLTAPQFDGERKIQAVTLTVREDGVARVECLVRDASISIDEQPDEPTPDDRLLAAIRQIIQSELPSGFRNDGSALILDGGTGTSEHVATVEGTCAILVSLLAVLLPPTPPPDVKLSAAVAAAAAADLTATAPLTLAAIAAAMAVKRTVGDDANGTKPGIGCPEVFAG